MTVRLKYGVSNGAMAHNQVMAPLNQIPIPLWYYPQKGGGSQMIQGELKALVNGTVGTELEGYVVGTILVKHTTCDARQYKDTEVDVVDWGGCIFDQEFDAMTDVWVWAVDDWHEDPDNPGEFLCGWSAVNRCCVETDEPPIGIPGDSGAIFALIGGLGA